MFQVSSSTYSLSDISTAFSNHEWHEFISLSKQCLSVWAPQHWPLVWFLVALSCWSSIPLVSSSAWSFSDIPTAFSKRTYTSALVFPTRHCRCGHRRSEASRASCSTEEEPFPEADPVIQSQHLRLYVVRYDGQAWSAQSSGRNQILEYDVGHTRSHLLLPRSVRLRSYVRTFFPHHLVLQ